MKKKRIIGVILLQNGWVVQSAGFSQFRRLGNPVTAVKRFAEWDADELIYLDISRDSNYDLNRDDLAGPNRNNIIDIYKDVAKVSFMPITFGGKIRDVKDVEDRLKIGADKIAINTWAFEKPEIITELAKKYGSQFVVVSIDVKTIDGKKFVFTNAGQVNTQMCPIEWASICQDKGAGELFINSIDCDGKKMGYDLELYESLKRIRIPIIACGGAGDWDHFNEVLKIDNVEGAAAANLFQHIDQSMYYARKHLFELGQNVRAPRANSIFL